MSEDTAQMEMPRYNCNKQVWALKIRKIRPSEEDDGAIIYPEEEVYARFKVTAAYVKKHQPEEGGYYVVYKDGYKSFSPATAFEEGYTKV